MGKIDTNKPFQIIHKSKLVNFASAPGCLKLIN